MPDAHPEPMPITSELVKALAAIAGVSLTDARADALAPQAEQQFALMRALDSFDPGDSEPMGEFRLDRPGNAR